MTEEPSDVDGPLMRNASEQAGAIDRATDPGERRRAWTRFLPAAVLAFLESYVREGALVIAALLSVIAILAGATSGSAGWAVAGAFAGVAGLVIALVPVIRRWSFAWRWVTVMAVIALQILVLVVFGLSNV
ncbi:hypothetical protein [Tenggerimyces flavus]|uniref:Uncharacterized protein n=1 Tax=Tenggerimyces flavus TaxID=1708749 RepID=A0ABV7YP85_9ACTN|nr:hypothetical protein [Tenggerimyces flavus]MBM7786468.1 hypothetical protein [Tenggerimyces flavus]